MPVRRRGGDHAKPVGTMLQKGNEAPLAACVLIVADDRDVREGLKETITAAGHRCIEAGDGRVVLATLNREAVDLVLLDLEIPCLPGLEVLRLAAELHPGIPVVIVSGRSTIREAIAATRLGAYDFIEKPVDAGRTLITVRNALERARLQRQRDVLLEEARERNGMGGSAPASWQVLQHAEQRFQVAVVQDLREAREQFERAFILQVLRAHEWRVQEAADRLGIDRSYLWKKMKRYALRHP